MSQMGDLSFFSSSTLVELEYLEPHDIMAMSTKPHICTAADQTPTDQAQLSDRVLVHAC